MFIPCLFLHFSALFSGSPRTGFPLGSKDFLGSTLRACAPGHPEILTQWLWSGTPELYFSSTHTDSKWNIPMPLKKTAL